MGKPVRGAGFFDGSSSFGKREKAFPEGKAGPLGGRVLVSVQV